MPAAEGRRELTMPPKLLPSLGNSVEDGAMDLSLTPEHEGFRRAVRQWLKTNVPKREDGNRVGVGPIEVDTFFG